MSFVAGSVPPPSAPPAPLSHGPVAPVAPSAPNITSPTSGLWVGLAVLSGILVSGTPAAPLAFGLLSVGLIYQLQQLLQGK